MRFTKRIYRNFGEFWRDAKFLARNRQKVRLVASGLSLSREFRQRLFMAVTVVNGCRYCSFYHARVALSSGVANEELQKLLSGVVDDCPDAEIPALLYAQHWAENDGQADEAARKILWASYGDATAEAVELALRMIRVGNLLGNSLDYFLYRISFGLLGLPNRR